MGVLRQRRHIAPQNDPAPRVQMKVPDRVESTPPHRKTVAIAILVESPRADDARMAGTVAMLMAIPATRGLHAIRVTVPER